jgi:hypothetical protein
MLRLTREDGQALVGHILVLAPLTIVLAFVLAVFVLTG